MNATQAATILGCTPEQAKRQYAKNARTLRWLALKASTSPYGHYRGKPEAYWRRKADEYETLSTGGTT